MTKHLAKDLVDQYAEILGYVFRSGRAHTTAQLHLVLGNAALAAFAGSAIWEENWCPTITATTSTTTSTTVKSCLR